MDDLKFNKVAAGFLLAALLALALGLALGFEAW